MFDSGDTQPYDTELSLVAAAVKLSKEEDERAALRTNKELLLDQVSAEEPKEEGVVAGKSFPTSPQNTIQAETTSSANPHLTNAPSRRKRITNSVDEDCALNKKQATDLKEHEETLGCSKGADAKASITIDNPASRKEVEPLTTPATTPKITKEAEDAVLAEIDATKALRQYDNMYLLCLLLICIQLTI